MLKRFDIKGMRFSDCMSRVLTPPDVELSFVKWIRTNTLDRFYFHSEPEAAVPIEAWADREQSEGTLKSYLADFPSKSI